MNLTSEIFGDVIVVHTPDELGGDEVAELPEYLSTLERQNVVLDLDGTEVLGSDGLSALLVAQDKLREVNGDARVATTNRYNRKIFEMTRLDEHLEVFDSVIEAVKSFC